MELNLNIPVEFNGKQIGDVSAGKSLSAHLYMSGLGNPNRMVEWAEKLDKDEPIELTEGEREWLLTFVQQLPSLPNVTKLIVINELTNGVQHRDTGKDN